jgi:DNA repair protein RadA/Sms
VLTRINEAEKLGFKHCILPKNSVKNLKFKKSDMEIIAVSTLKEALDIILGSAVKK